MELIYNSIAEHINQLLPGLSLIDEDCGQLTATDEGYPVTFPCVLISVPTIDWAIESMGTQRGECLFQVKLAFDCYNDTHLSSDPGESIADRSRLNKLMCQALSRYVINAGMSPLMRVQSRQYTLPGIVKVYEHTYKCKITDNLLEIVE